MESGKDYLFFTKVQVLESRATAKFSEACMVGTRKAIFIVPIRSLQSFLIATQMTHYDRQQDPVEATRALLESAPSVAALEEELTARLEGDKESRVFRLDQLETFQMKTGFFGQTKLKLPGDKVKLVNIRDKGGKKVAKDFYSFAL